MALLFLITVAHILRSADKGQILSIEPANEDKIRKKSIYIH